jgi:hypothetical protein
MAFAFGEGQIVPCQTPQGSCIDETTLPGRRNGTIDCTIIQAALRVLTHALLTSSDVVRHRSTISDIDSLLLMECSFSDAARSWGSLN